MNFCLEVIVPTKTVHCSPNNKYWITSDVKDILNKKKKWAFKGGERPELKCVQGELKVQLKEAKESSGRRVEQKEVWGRDENHRRLQQ